MKNKNNKILVRYMGNVVLFYELVRESEKSVWLQQIGSKTVQNPRNDGHVWEVKPVPSDKIGNVFRKLKTPKGRVKFGKFEFLTLYDERKEVFERNF